jgi:hypothetical protein
VYYFVSANYKMLQDSPKKIAKKLTRKQHKEIIQNLKHQNKKKNSVCTMKIDD